MVRVFEQLQHGCREGSGVLNKEYVFLNILDNMIVDIVAAICVVANGRYYECVLVWRIPLINVLLMRVDWCGVERDAFFVFNEMVFNCCLVRVLHKLFSF